jgi:hypothetical protein
VIVFRYVVAGSTFCRKMLQPLGLVVFTCLLASSAGFLWHAIPIILAISLVYGATRHELVGPILHNAYRTAVWIVGFMAVIFAILWVISWLV